jgi:hypothetical protein
MYPCLEAKALPNFKELFPIKIQNKKNYMLNIPILGTKIRGGGGILTLGPQNTTAVVYYAHYTDVNFLTFSPCSA